jgi:cell division protein FtsI/penicillin-binding protein 2
MTKPLSLLLILTVISCSSEKTEFDQIFQDGSPFFKETLRNSAHEIQVIYGRIYKDSIVHHKFNVDSSAFYYPASTVKMPVAFAAMETLQQNGWSLDSKILIDSSEHNPRRVIYDSLYNDTLVVRNLIKKIFTVSDNQSYNLLYGWLGKEYINRLNQKIGLSSSRIIHQLSESAFSFTPESNRNTFKTTIIDGQSSVQFEALESEFKPGFSPSNQVRGLGYVNDSGELIEQPFDFSQKNFIALEDLLGCLERVIKPGLFKPDQRYSFDPRMYRELEQIMKMRPNGLPSPLDTLADNYVKFFMYGDSKNGTYPANIEIRNKVGWAYGYLTDVAYIRDYVEEVEFFLAATIHVNENKIYNDGVYEYEEIGLPFLGELGRLVYEYELSLK